MKKSRTSAEGLSLVEEYQRSGLSRRQFCAARNLPLTTLDYWRERKKRAAAKPRLLEVSVTPAPPSVTVAIYFPNGRRIECPWNLPEPALSSLIRTVESA